MQETLHLRKTPPTSATEQTPAPTEPGLHWQVAPQEHNHRVLNTILILLLLASPLIWWRWDNFTLALVFGIGAISLWLVRYYEDYHRTVHLNEDGLTVDGRHHHLADFTSFWLEYSPNGLREIRLQPRQWFAPTVRVALGNQHPVPVRQVLITYLPEVEHRPSLVEVVLHKLGF